MKSYRDGESEEATMRIEIGKYLAAARDEKGLTQEDVAADIGEDIGAKNAQSISNWERGRQKPSIIQLLKLSDYLVKMMRNQQ